MVASSPLVVTVIPNYNGGAHLLETLGSLCRSDHAPQEVIVVDDCSTDHALEEVASTFRDTIVVRNATNKGFAGSANRGIAEALRQGAEFVFLLNNDAVVSPSAIRLLVDVLRGEPGIAAAMPLIYNFSPPEVIQSAGLGLNRETGEATQIGWNAHDDGQFATITDRQGLHGCAMMIARGAWEDVGQFWEPFFAYYEESDWCIRARDRGYRLLLVPQAHAWHHGGMSWDFASPRYLYLLMRNRLYFVKRNRTKAFRMKHVGKISADYLREIARSVRRRRLRHAAAVVRAVTHFALGVAGPDKR